MKKIVKINILLALITFLGACDNYLDINKDPNNAPEGTESTTFPTGAGSVAYVVGGQYQILGAIWAQHWTQSVGANQYANTDDYDLTTTSFDTREFGELYSGALSDLDFVSKRAANNESWIYFLMSEVMTAYTYQLLVDFYDQVPYAEALKGAEGNLNPVYDNGDAVYDDLIKRIDNALSKNFDQPLVGGKGVVVPGNDDIIFQGDLDSWIRFANTLKLRMFIRQSYARPDVASAGIASLYSSGAQFLETDAAMGEFLDIQNKRNPYYATQISADGNGRGNVDVAASNTALNYLLDHNDPRADALYATPRNGGAHRGLDQGDYNNTTVPSNSARGLSQPVIGPTDPVYFMSASESYFLQAEAILLYPTQTGRSLADAQQLYERGIEASFERLDLEVPDELMVDPDYAFDGTQERIITQKWLSFINIQGTEAFFEYNRTGYPSFFTASRNNATGGQFPKRLLFPNSEYSRNDANTPELKLITQPVWWDK